MAYISSFCRRRRNQARRLHHPSAVRRDMRPITHDDSATHGPRVRELFQRSVAQIRAAHFIDAMTCLDELLALDGSHADALAFRGWIHARHGNSAAACTDLQAAL